MDRDTLYQLLVRAGLDKIKRTGEGFMALCPFHDNTRSPAWGINADTGLWKCWSDQCGEVGNLTTFLIRVVHMPYDQAVEFARDVPEVAGDEPVTWPSYDARVTPAEEERVAEATLGMYDYCPRYMLDRGFPKRFLREFDIGFDQQAGRVTFPVRDVQGRVLGFTRRAIDNAWPKYLHDFEKTKTLYLIHLVQYDQLVCVTEGTVDALMGRLRGRQTSLPVSPYLRNAVATLGGGLSDSQANLLVRRAPRSVLLGFDEDAAGISATRKSIGRLRAQGVGEVLVLQYPASMATRLAESDGKPDVGALDIVDVHGLSLLPSHRWLSSHH